LRGGLVLWTFRRLRLENAMAFSYRREFPAPDAADLETRLTD
jgi:hypothetical protein